MPYASNCELPVGVQRHLTSEAQDIYRKAFNRAWFRYAPEHERREEIAHRIAWTAVKRSFHKVGSEWVPHEYYEHEPTLH